MTRYRGRLILGVALLQISAFAADNDERGIQLGSVIGYGAGGFGHDSGSGGIAPSFGGGIVVGLTRHFGLFGDGAYTRISGVPSTANFPGVGSLCFCGGVKPNLVNVAVGVEVVGRSRSRFVPYAKVGPGYGYSANGRFGSQSFDDYAPAIALGGGLRGYIKKRFGIEAQVLVLRYVGGNGGGVTVIPTLGVFAQSK